MPLLGRGIAGRVTAIPGAACELYLDELGDVCGSTDDVDRYLPGLRCRPHSPRVRAGRPDPSCPGPPTQLAPRVPREYGTKREDPLGRVFYGGKKFGIPSYPCPEGCDRPKGHALPHNPPASSGIS